jgi:hypothetical protein
MTPLPACRRGKDPLGDRHSTSRNVAPPDGAHGPADPVADLAAAARTFVPLAPLGLLAEAGFDPLPDLAVRLRTFLDGYGLTDRKAILLVLRRCALDEHELSGWLQRILPDLARGP